MGLSRVKAEPEQDREKQRRNLIMTSKRIKRNLKRKQLKTMILQQKFPPRKPLHRQKRLPH